MHLQAIIYKNFSSTTSEEQNFPATVESLFSFFIIIINRNSFGERLYEILSRVFYTFFSVFSQNWPHKIKNRECIHVFVYIQGFTYWQWKFSTLFCFFVYSKFPDIFFILLKVWFVKFVSVFYMGLMSVNDVIIMKICYRWRNNWDIYDVITPFPSSFLWLAEAFFVFEISASNRVRRLIRHWLKRRPCLPDCSNKFQKFHQSRDKSEPAPHL